MGKLEHESWWVASTADWTFPALDRDIAADVVVIGAGITGLSTAWALKRAGKTVVVLDRHGVAVAESGYTTAHLTQAFDTGLAKLTENFGRDGAKAVWDAGRLAIDTIAATCQEQGIDAEFARVPGYLFALRPEDVATIEEEGRLARELGFDAVVTADSPFPTMANGALRIANQARFHPRKYLLALAERIQGKGSHVFGNSPAEEWLEGTGDAPWQVKVGAHVVTAQHLVFATHQPIHDKLYAARVPAYQTYALAWEVPTGAFGDALAWDTAEPYHYWRITPGAGHDLLIVGGEDHRTGQDDAEAAYARLTAYVEGVLGAQPHKQAYRWSGQWLEPVDGAPYIGAAPGMPRAWIATGFGGNGMTMGVFAGGVIADGIAGLARPDAALFDPGRLNLRAGAVTFLTENLAFPAYMLMDRLAPAERTAVADLRPGEGAIVNVEGQKAAAARDTEGKLHVVSALCTHMGCVVHWNSAETTWDCPCHGSRFTPDGTVQSGPARLNLPPCQLKKEGTGKR